MVRLYHRERTPVTSPIAASMTWIDLLIDLAIIAMVVLLAWAIGVLVSRQPVRRRGRAGGVVQSPDEWAARIPRRAPDDPDPIQQLVDALEVDGKPPLAWVIKWSEGGRCDPVFAAWQNTTDVWAMQRLLRLAGWPDAEVDARYSKAIGEDPREMLPDAFRRAVPVPPPLSELLEAVAVPPDPSR